MRISRAGVIKQCGVNVQRAVTILAQLATDVERSRVVSPELIDTLRVVRNHFNVEHIAAGADLQEHVQRLAALIRLTDRNLDSSSSQNYVIRHR
jgi:hypothetical protein